MKCFVTGAAGFIGSNLVDRLLADGHQVVGFDNLATGQRRFLEQASAQERFTLVTGDILDEAALVEASRGCDTVFHLAANADVRFGPDHPDRDLKQNTIGTFNVLEAARKNGIGRFAFSSTGSVYGEATVIPTPEDAAFPVQTSLYGASKLAGEGLIAAYCEAFGIRGWIFRFVSILGERYSHGHVYDFCRSLFSDRGKLRILGDGLQKKSYLYVQDCVSAMLTAVEKAPGKVNVFNLGTDEYVQVRDSVRIITDELKVSPSLEYTGGARGWIGDNPFILLDCRRIRELGWKPSLTIEESVRRTVRYIQANRWLLESRH
ncbi:MAG TPA: NAD-dependent epimerase/dehydratase family protein [Spirochaetia bacterium]|nr:NAD-dependent epimerase/dehydratase family protein [Spirochaetia bacterium]